MTLQDLRYLVALAELGSFVRAAEFCCIGQSTLSTQIIKLESFLGVKLFERGKQPVRLTLFGEQIPKRRNQRYPTPMKSSSSLNNIMIY